MARIQVLGSDTINKIAAGEVVERPVNVVKELVENSIDAGATAVSVEIKDGGISLIRVTDNGSGIEPDQVTTAFCRHATSKIRDEEDLSHLVSLGFRGEALSSIAAVSEVEMITRTKERIYGIRAVNRALPSAASPSRALQTADDAQFSISEIGAPAGTTVIVRNLFVNVPVRRKFLKTPVTEAGYITDLVEHFALSHPDISFHYRVNGQEKLHTSGNGNEKELIYRIYGRDMASSVIPIHTEGEGLALSGNLGRPEFSRGSRSFEIFFVNGRILKSDVLSRALEEGYGTDLMQHRFPFAILHLVMPPEEVDVNVHPAKMEVRFSEAKKIYDFIKESVHAALHKTELIPKASLNTQAEENARLKEEEKERTASAKDAPHLEPFERKEKEAAPSVLFEEPASYQTEARTTEANTAPARAEEPPVTEAPAEASAEVFAVTEQPAADHLAESFVFEDRRPAKGEYRQESFFVETPDPFAPKKETKAAEADKAQDAPAVSDALDIAAAPGKAQESSGDAEDTPDLHDEAYAYKILTPENAREYRYIGQAFKTYWIIEFRNRLLLIDQHAAHEKVNFERLMKRLKKEEASPAPSQMVAPPIIVHLSGKEEGALLQHEAVFTKMGYEIESFGGGSYAIRAIPMELYANDPADLLKEILDEILNEKMGGTPAAILYKIASMSCKAAVKGNTELSEDAAKALIDELLSLEDPYHCPHGRPTMIVMTQSEMDKKFKRIV